MGLGHPSTLFPFVDLGAGDADRPVARAARADRRDPTAVGRPALDPAMRIDRIRGGGDTGKTPVVGAVRRKGNVVVRVVESIDIADLIRMTP